MRKPTLIDEWSKSWRLLSVQLGAVAVTFGLLPPEQQTSILEALHVPAERVPAVLGVLFLLGRLVKQKD